MADFSDVSERSSTRCHHRCRTPKPGGSSSSYGVANQPPFDGNLRILVQLHSTVEQPPPSSTRATSPSSIFKHYLGDKFFKAQKCGAEGRGKVPYRHCGARRKHPRAVRPGSYSSPPGSVVLAGVAAAVTRPGRATGGDPRVHRVRRNK
jgi:hypothetical protein